jgi:hypothetical protein
MGYKTLKAIRDLQDNEHHYSKGEEYPRKGFEVAQERLDELVQIGAIEKTQDLNKLTKAELISLAEDNQVDVSESDTKAEIIEKLGE